MTVLATTSGSAVSRIQTGEYDRVIAYALDNTNTGVTGATVSLEIRRDVDGFWWNGTALQSAHTSVSMAALDATNYPGVYYYDFLAPVAQATYLMRATTATAAVVTDPWLGQVKAGYWVDDIDAALSSLSTSSQSTTLLARIGAINVDIELRRLGGILDKILKKMP